SRWAGGGVAGLDGIPDPCRKIDVIKAVDLLNARGRGDVDLGQVIANDVDADEDQPLFLQGRTDRIANFAIPGAEAAGHGLAADMQVRARLPFRRDAVDRAGRLAVDQNDALVAIADLRQVALRNHRLSIELGKHFLERVQILILSRDMKDAGAAVTEQRLDDD